MPRVIQTILVSVVKLMHSYIIGGAQIAITKQLVFQKKNLVYLYLRKVHNALACGLSQKYYVFNHITCTDCCYTFDQINYSCKELRFHVNHGNMSASADTAVWSQNPLIYE